MDPTPRVGRCAFPHCKVVGSVEAAHGGNSSPHTSIGVGPPWRQNRKAPRPGIEPGLQEPESDSDPTAAANRFGIQN